MRLTFTSAGDLVSQDVDLVDSAELREHLGEFRLVHGVRDLTHEHLDEVRVRLLSTQPHTSGTRANS